MECNGTQWNQPASSTTLKSTRHGMLNDTWRHSMGIAWNFKISQSESHCVPLATNEVAPLSTIESRTSPRRGCPRATTRGRVGSTFWSALYSVLDLVYICMCIMYLYIYRYSIISIHIYTKPRTEHGAVQTFIDAYHDLWGLMRSSESHCVPLPITEIAQSSAASWYAYTTLLHVLYMHYCVV